MRHAMNYPDIPMEQSYTPGRGAGNTRIQHVTPPANFVSGEGKGKSDVVLGTDDSMGIWYDTNRDDRLYGIDFIKKHISQGGK